MSNNVLSIEQYNAKQSPILTIYTGDKDVKRKKDGTVKKTHCNKKLGKDAEVYAFRTQKEIQAMIDVFDSHINQASNNDRRKIAYRNKLLFLIGINVGIRASDLRMLKWSFFFDVVDGEYVFKRFYSLQPQKQKKYKKYVKIFFNQAVQNAIKNYIDVYPIEDIDDYLFVSRNGGGFEPISVEMLWGIIKKAAKEAGIEQNIGSHSLRKTFGFWCWHESEDKDRALVILQQIFAHSSTQTTARYIGILDDEIEDMFGIDLGLEMM